MNSLRGEISNAMKLPHEPDNRFVGQKNGQKVANEVTDHRVTTRGSLETLKERIQNDSEQYFHRSTSLPNYVIRVKHGRNRKYFPLETELGPSAKKARDLKAHLRLHGWAKTVEVFRPFDSRHCSELTVGDFLELVRLHSAINPVTFHTYARKLRTVVSGVLNLRHRGVEKFNGTKEDSVWKKTVDGVALEKLTPTSVARWRSRYLASRGESGRDRVCAEHTVNNIIRNARSLFSAKVLKDLRLAVPRLVLPSPLPFEGIDLLPEHDADYHYYSQVDAAKLIEKALHELSGEPLVIFVLAIGGGLRRKEIDNLEWSKVDLASNTVQVAPPRIGILKSDHSRGTVLLEKRMMGVLCDHSKHGVKGFVLCPERPARVVTTYSYYRCEKHFKRLIGWLRPHGFTDTDQLIHLLRKEYGSNIAENHGIHVACASLRQGTIALTARTYANRHVEETSFFSPPAKGESNADEVAARVVELLKAKGLVMKQPV